VFGVASVAGGFTTSPAQLIAARAVMGLGAAMTFPATLSLISNVFTGRAERARAIGLWGASAGSRPPWAAPVSECGFRFARLPNRKLDSVSGRFRGRR